MSTLKDKLTNIIGRLTHFFSRLAKSASTRWRSLTPGFRYAIVYFLCVVCIASLVWWQFNPGNSWVFDPTAGLPREGGDDHHGQDPEIPPEEGEEESEDGEVFSPLRGDKLILPLEGEILASLRDPFGKFPGLISGGIDGIHIDGTAGDDVCAAWRGVVSDVIVPGTLDAGEVWIKHGEWTTVYINVENIIVSPGDAVLPGQKLGELAAKLFGPYSGDYLEFQLWGPAQEVCDPWQYASVDH